MLKIVARNKKESKYICSEKMMRGGLFFECFPAGTLCGSKKIFLTENMHDKVHIKKQKIKEFRRKKFLKRMSG